MDGSPPTADERPRWQRLLGDRRTRVVVGLLAPMVVMIVNLWRMKFFTIDDAYISYRYARNLARGWGLVFNQGEAIEGYTNFLWTIFLAGGWQAGIDPDVMAKVMGAASACGTMVLCYLLSGRIQPYRVAPSVCTWLLATSVPTVGYAMFGLETAFFVFAIVGGLLLMFVEYDRPKAFPWSAVAFGIAALTRPEAPMFIGLASLALGRKIFARQSIMRGFVFVAIVGAHLLWRKHYYDAWVPNTFTAKTGDVSRQFDRGWGYVGGYIAEAGPAVFMVLAGLAIGVVRRSREAITLGLLTIGVVGYIMTVGGDWMPHFRFMAPFEPFAFVLVGVGARAAFDSPDRAARVAIAVFALYVGVDRYYAFEKARKDFIKDDEFWEGATIPVSKYIVEHNRPGTVAVADMGFIGYATDMPILDLLGLVDPVISKLPGAYTKKIGPGYVKRVFDVMPMYFVLVGTKDCNRLSFPGQRKLHKHPKFRRNYDIARVVSLPKGGTWCVFERKQ